MTSQEMESFKGYNFGNVGSLLKVEIIWWLIESLVVEWHTVTRVFQLEAIDLCPTIEE